MNLREENLVLEVVDWDKNFENSRSRSIENARWVPIPNRHDGLRYSRLIKSKDGAEIFAAWILIVEVASKCKTRGVLTHDDGEPITAEDIAEITRAPLKWFEKAISYLTGEKVRWLRYKDAAQLSPGCQADSEQSTGRRHLAETGANQAGDNLPTDGHQGAVTSRARRMEGKKEWKEHTPLPPEGEESEELILSGEEKKTRRAVQAEAEKIYQAYPRKVGKPDALRAIGKALKKQSFEFLLSKTQEYAGVRERSGEDPGFIPHPATWFNREQFNDDPSTWVRGGGGDRRPEPGVTPPLERKPPELLGELFQEYLYERKDFDTIVFERATTEGWKTRDQLPLSVRDDFDEWKGRRRQAQMREARR